MSGRKRGRSPKRQKSGENNEAQEGAGEDQSLATAELVVQRRRQQRELSESTTASSDRSGKVIQTKTEKVKKGAAKNDGQILNQDDGDFEVKPRVFRSRQRNALDDLNNRVSQMRIENDVFAKELTEENATQAQLREDLQRMRTFMSHTLTFFGAYGTALPGHPQQQLVPQQQQEQPQQQQQQVEQQQVQQQMEYSELTGVSTLPDFSGASREMAESREPSPLSAVNQILDEAVAGGLGVLGSSSHSAFAEGDLGNTHFEYIQASDEAISAALAAGATVVPHPDDGFDF